MKIVAKILSLRRKECGDALIDRLIEIYPEGRYGRQSAFFLVLPADDHRTIEVVDVLQKAGLTPYADKTRSPIAGREYWIEYSRSYDKSDYEAAEFLMPQLGYGFDCGRGDDGGEEMLIDPGQLDSTWDFAADASGAGLLASNRARLLLERSGLRGIKFRPAILQDDHDIPTLRPPWGGEYGEPWWELYSDITLPPLSPKMIITDRKGKPVPRGTHDFVFVQDDPRFMGLELHYLRSEMERMPEFDFAQSTEWPSLSPLDRWLVVSKRFYEFCKKNQLKCDYVPVRLDVD